MSTAHRFLAQMLGDLHELGLRLGVITNGGTAFQRNTLRALGIERSFEAVLISESEGIKKPDPASFHRAVARLGVSAEESLFVGDHPSVDVAGARKAGLKAIWKRADDWEPPDDADGVIDHLHELPASITRTWTTPARALPGTMGS
jgi:putative hydrolase of the HAD superfamily